MFITLNEDVGDDDDDDEEEEDRCCPPVWTCIGAKASICFVRKVSRVACNTNFIVFQYAFTCCVGRLLSSIAPQ